MIAKPRMPSYTDLHWPTLKALESLGGSASVQELTSRIATDMGLTDEILDVPHKGGPQTEFAYRAAWARTNLKGIGAVDNTARGVWAITDKGRGLRSERQLRDLVRSHVKARRAKRRGSANGPEPETAHADNDQNWEDKLLRILQSMKPDAFERLCQRVLRESGFTRVEVTGRSGDGGIDGAGVLRVELISFHVRFQCKRYAGSVGAPAIRDFRGAMVGRSDKGLFITTGAFTKEAQREAVRDGAPAIDLIDGSELCILLKKHELGVKTVQEIAIEAEFFKAI